MAAITVAAAEDACAKLNQTCDYFPPYNKDCCKGMMCTLSYEKWLKNDTSLKGECHIDPNAPTCRGPGQPCGNLDGTPNMPQLSTNTTCCDNMECDVISRKCKFPGLTCRKEGQPCVNVDNDLFLSDHQKASLSSNPSCCPGLVCGTLEWCYKPPKIECSKEGESCRLNGCCGGLHCNRVENDHTGEAQYQCQKKTCNTEGTCSTLGGSGCCDSHYCNPHWVVVGSCELRN